MKSEDLLYIPPHVYMYLCSHYIYSTVYINHTEYRTNHHALLLLSHFIHCLTGMSLSPYINLPPPPTDPLHFTSVSSAVNWGSDQSAAPLLPCPQLIGRPCGTLRSGRKLKAGSWTSSTACPWTFPSFLCAQTHPERRGGSDVTDHVLISLKMIGHERFVSDDGENESWT